MPQSAPKVLVVASIAVQTERLGWHRGSTTLSGFALINFAVDRRMADRWNLSERFVAGDRYPVAIAALRIVVPQRKMLCAAVVPERQRICLPPEAALEFGVAYSFETLMIST